MRILHLSDLNFGPEKRSRECKTFADDLVAHAGEHSVDYFIACGNITKDGRKESFDLAESFLKGVLDRILVRDSNEIEVRANRVILVPGKNDFGKSHSESLEIFSTFQQNVVHSDGWRSMFDTNQLMVRDLKDLSLVVIPHLQNGDVARWFNVIRTHVFEKQHNYAYNTPTLLISPDSLLINPTARAQLSDSQIASVLETKLRIDLHLFGSAPIFCLAFEPFVYRHLALSTGPRRGKQCFPRRFNVIDLTLSDRQGRPSSLKQALTISIHEKSKNLASKWSGTEIVSGHLDQFINRKQVGSLENIGLREIAKHVLTFPDKIHLMERLPLPSISSRKSQVIAINGEQIKFLFCQLLTTTDVYNSDERGAKKGSLVSKQRNSAIDELSDQIAVDLDNVDLVIVIVSDLARDDVEDGSRRMWTGEIIDQLLRLANIGSPDSRVEVVYEVAPSNSPRELAHRIKSRIAPVVIENQHERSDSNSVPSVGIQVPTHTESMKKLAARSLDLSLQLLESAAAIFHDLPGAICVNSAVAESLLHNAARHHAMTKFVEDLNDVLDRFRAWPPLRLFVQSQHDRIELENWPVLEIDLRAVSGVTKTSEKDMNALLRMFEQHGLATRLTDHTYHLASLPFSCKVFYAGESLPMKLSTEKLEVQLQFEVETLASQFADLSFQDLTHQKNHCNRLIAETQDRIRRLLEQLKAFTDGWPSAKDGVADLRERVLRAEESVFQLTTRLDSIRRIMLELPEDKIELIEQIDGSIERDISEEAATAFLKEIASIVDSIPEALPERARPIREQFQDVQQVKQMLHDSNTKLSAKNKLKMVIPIIPFLLNWELEVELGASLQRVWNGLCKLLG